MDLVVPPRNTINLQCCSCDSPSSCCWCVDCNESLCDGCFLAHRRVTITRAHRILDKPPKGANQTPATRFCRIHPTEPLKLFCFTCQQLTCRDCQLISHMNHRYQFVTEALQKLKKHVDGLLQPVRSQNEATIKSMKDMEDRLKDIAESEVQLETELNQAYKMLTLHMQKRIQEILVAAKQVSEQEREQIRAKVTMLKDVQSQNQGLVDQAEAAKNSNDFPPLLKFAMEVQTFLKKAIDQDLSPPKNMIQMKVTTDKPALDAILTFGQLRIQTVPFAVDRSSSEAADAQAASQVNPLSCQSPAADSLSTSISTYLNTASTTSASTSTSSVAAPGQTRGGGVGKKLLQLLPRSQTPPVCAPVVLQAVAPPNGVLSVVPSQPALNQQTILPQNQPGIVQVTEAYQVIQVSNLKVPVLTQLPLILNQNSSFSQAGQTRSNKSNTSNGSEANTKRNWRNNQVLLLTNSGTTAEPNPCVLAFQPQNQTTHQHKPMPLSSHKPFQNQAQTPEPQPLQAQQPSLVQKLKTEVIEILDDEETPGHRASLVHNQIPDKQPLGHNKQTPNQQPLLVHNQISDKQPPGYNKQTPEQQPLLVHNQIPDKQPPGYNKQTPDQQLLSACETSPARKQTTDNKASPCNLQTQHKQALQDNKQKPLSPHKQATEQETALHASKTALAPVLQDKTQKLDHQPLPVHEQSLDEEPLPDHHTLEHQPLSKIQQSPPQELLEGESAPAVHLQLPPDSPCSSKPHQLSPVVKAVADSACDSNVQQVVLRELEPAENEPTSTMCEELESLASPETCDMGTEDWSSETECPDFKLSQWQPVVSLYRLPLSPSHPGDTLPQFRLVAAEVEDELYLEEIGEDPESVVESVTEDDTEPASPFSPPVLQTVSCSACGSADGSIICSACGRGYHRDCHLPPIGYDIWMEWTCSLCQDLSNPVDPYSSDRPPNLQSTGLSLHDQRCCESLLLYLKVEGFSQLSPMPSVWSRLTGMAERLTQRRLPVYQTSAELLYNIWRLLKEATEDHEGVNKLLEDFQKKVKETFSSELPAPAHTKSRTQTHEEGAEPKDEDDDDVIDVELMKMKKRLSSYLAKSAAKRRKMENGNPPL